MLLSSIPAKIVEAFAVNGTKNTIPVASQIGITPGAASFNDGFPPLTATPLAAGGVPPSVGDMNGVLFDISAWAAWMSAGGTVQYDSTFSAAIGGYPKNAVLASTTAGLLWMNSVDNNTTNPDSGGSNWLPIQTGGFLTTVSTKSAAYTITTSDNGALIVAGAYAMTLPSAPATAFRVTILSSATGTTILPNGNTVNLASGATSSTISLPAAGDFLTLVWDGSVWRVVGESAVMLAASTVSTKSAAYTITTSDNGALIVAGAYAMTLPSAPATAFRVTILSSATGTTILPNGNTVNLASGATSSTISLPAAGDFVTLAWDGSVWRVVDGSAAMLNAAPLAGSTTQQFNVAAATSSANAVNLGQFPNSIGSSGYQKLPNGLILQWGYLAATNGTFNFPIAFPNAALSFFACNSNSQGAFVDNAYGYIVSNTQFFIATKTSYPDSDTISNYPCTWLALGN